MPSKPPRVCGCGIVVAAGLMCACQIDRRAEADKRRPTASQRGYDSKWQKASKSFLAKPENHLCACGCSRVADMVDHVVPHRGDMKLFWDKGNWQALASSPCHNSRKQRQERAA